MSFSDDGWGLDENVEVSTAPYVEKPASPAQIPVLSRAPLTLNRESNGARGFAVSDDRWGLNEHVEVCTAPYVEKPASPAQIPVLSRAPLTLNRESNGDLGFAVQKSEFVSQPQNGQSSGKVSRITNLPTQVDEKPVRQILPPRSERGTSNSTSRKDVGMEPSVTKYPSLKTSSTGGQPASFGGQLPDNKLTFAKQSSSRFDGQNTRSAMKPTDFGEDAFGKQDDRNSSSRFDINESNSSLTSLEFGEFPHKSISRKVSEAQKPLVLGREGMHSRNSLRYDRYDIDTPKNMVSSGSEKSYGAGFGSSKPSGFGGTQTTPGGFGSMTKEPGFGGDRGVTQSNGFGGSQESSNGFGSRTNETRKYSGFVTEKLYSRFDKVQNSFDEISSRGKESLKHPLAEDEKPSSEFGESQESSKSFGSMSNESFKPSEFGDEEPPSEVARVKGASEFDGAQESYRALGSVSKESIKPSGFGGDEPPTEVAAVKEAIEFDGAKELSRPLGSVSNESIKPSGFGGDEPPTKVSEVKEASVFGGSQTPSNALGSISNESIKPSGFGGDEPSTEVVRVKEVSVFGRYQAPSNALASRSNESLKSSGFGGDEPDGFSATVKNRPVFGSGVAGESKGFGFSGNSGFGASAGFGATSNSGFGSPFGGNKFGSGDNGFSKNEFGDGVGRFGDNQERKSGCFNCGKDGHRKDQCSEPPKVSTCRNCGEEGHFSRECEKPKVPNGPCRNCGIEGHYSRDCTEPRVPNGPCRNCGQPGHFAKDCENERVHVEPVGACRRCGEEGHWSSDCPTRARDLQGNILVPYEVQFVPETELFEDAVDNDSRICFDQKVYASTGSYNIPDYATFDEFKLLPPKLNKNLKRMKINRPTPIQKASFFPILSGTDVVACAHTGSGKTLAFLIPFATQLLEDVTSYDGVRDDKPSPGLLIVAPTRELACQTFDTARQLTYETGLKCGIAYGGYARNANIQHLRSFEQLNILVATMGRLQDFLESGDVSLEKLRYIVLDEADRMVDANDFGLEVSKIIGPPAERVAQTVLFSASFSENLQRDNLPDFVRKGYTMLQVDKFGTANEKIDQQFLSVSRSEKRSELCKLIGLDENTYTILPEARIQHEKTLIFVNTVKFSDSLACFLCNAGVQSIPMHSHQNQEQRDRTLNDFRRGKWMCMVASNVCARGLNISGLDHVINYDMPDKSGFDEYVNRIGRTARAGFTGFATSFVDLQADREIISSLVDVLAEAGKEVPEWLADIKENEEAFNDEEDPDEKW
uniref:RNA helicase n=1 Tax=Caenorhabditis japonica TaxID=281687 RepID=A0A8R1E1B9_CAEJA